MNMISTGAFQTEMDASNKQSTIAEKFAAVWEKKNAKAARAGGVSLMALSLAACGSDSSTTDTSSGGSTDSSSTSTVSAGTTVKLANNGGTYSLTTTVDGVSAPASGSAKIYLNDNEPGDAYSFTLDASAAGSGALVIEFADVGDTATLAADSTFGNFSSLEVKNGTVDVTAMTLPTGLNSVTVNSGLKLTATQVQQITSVAGTGDFTIVATTQAEIDAVIAHFAANSISVSTTVAAASGSTLTAADITAANTNVAAEVASNTTAVTTTTVLTTKLDSGASFTGGAGADEYTGTLTFASNAVADSATLTAGDTIDGGAGTDSVTITVTGAAVTDAGEIATPTFTNIEKIHVRSFETDASGITGAAATIQQDSVEIDLSNSTGYTEIGTTATNNVEADVVFANVSGLPSIVMAGKGDLRIENTAASVTAVTDSMSVTLNDVGTDKTTMSSLNINGVETVNITSATAANFLTLEDAAYTTVTVAGDQDLRMDVKDTGVTSFDASAATGDLYIDLADITLSNLTSVKGGAGTSDTVVIDEAVTVNATPTNTLEKFSGFETLAVEGTTAVTLTTTTTGITDFDFTHSGNQTLTLNDGFTGDVTVSIKGDSTNADVITNSANVALTVTANGADLDGTITGGTGTDTINVTADGATTTVASTITGVEQINIVAAANPSTVVGLTMDNANVASGKSMTVDASALTDSDAVFTFSAAAETDGTYTVTGGAGKDQLTAGAKGDTIDGGANDDTITGGAGNDTLTGGAGKDTITLNAGDDTVSAGDGKDTIIAGANLTKADTVDGGAGEDTLRVTSVSADALAGVTNVENLQISGGATVSLSADLAFTTIDTTNGATAEAITLAKGYTAATTFKIDAGDDITNTGADAVITITANADDLEAADDTLIAGSDKAGVTNSLEITNNASATVDLASDISNIDSITVKDSTVTTGNDITFSMASYASAISIDVSELDKGEDSTVSGTSAKAITYTGGGGVDTVVLSSDTTAADNLSLGDGKDVITGGTNIGYDDVIDGGAGVDTLTATDIADVDLQNTSNVETLTVAGTTAAANLGAYASAAGIVTVNTTSGSNQTVVASGMTTGVTFVAGGADTETITGGTGDDTFVFQATETLTAADVLNGTSGVDKIRIDNDDDADATGDATTAVVDQISNIDEITINDTATDNAAGDVTLTVGDGSGGAAANYDQAALTVDGTSLDAGEALTFNASANTDTDEVFTVTGGAGADTIRGGAGADTITGGSGADIIDGGAGADTVTGGAGADTFEYSEGDSTSAKKDTIADFAASSDSLRVTLAADGATSTVNMVDLGDATSISDGLSLLSSKEGEYFFDTTNKQLVIDLDGNGLIQSSDMVIAMTDETGFAAADMVAKVTGGSGANTITTGDGNDVILGGDGIDTITAGKGNDFIQGSASGDSSDADVMIGGAGNDTYSFVTASAANNLITETSGTDTLLITGNISLANLEVGADNSGSAGTDLVGATDALKIEQIVINAGDTATFASTQLTANAIAVNASGAGTTTLATSTIASGASLDLSNLTFSAVTYTGSDGLSATGTAFDANDIIDINGSTGVQTITAAGTVKNVITLGAGDDVITCGSGIDMIEFAASSNGNDAIGSFGSTDILDLDALVTGGVYNSLTAVGGATTAAIALANVSNKAVKVSVADITASGIAAASLEANFIAASKAFSAEGTSALDFVLIFGETSGTDGVEVYHVTDGTGANDMAAVQIASLSGISLADIAAANLDVA